MTTLCRGYGTAAVRRAYADWANPLFGKHQEDLAMNGVDLIQVARVGIQNKNATYIRMAVDAMETPIVHPRRTPPDLDEPAAGWSWPSRSGDCPVTRTQPQLIWHNVARDGAVHREACHGQQPLTSRACANTRRYPKPEFGCLRCSRRGCFMWVFLRGGVLPEQCLRGRPGTDFLVAVAFRT